MKIYVMLGISISLCLLLFIIVYFHSSEPAQLQGFSREHIDSIVLYDINPLLDRYSTEARATATQYVLDDSEYSLFEQVRFDGADWMKSMALLAEITCKDGTTYELHFNGTYVRNDVEKGHWAGSKGFFMSLNEIIQREFVPIRQDKYRSTSPADNHTSTPLKTSK